MAAAGGGGVVGAVRYAVGEGETYTRLSDALTKWQTDAPPAAVIEITDSGVYVEPIRISLAANQQLVLRAANGVRPVSQFEKSLHKAGRRSK